ncbi:MAG: hypothetical protein JO316_24355 [Abitibacteriaceae bacterium]|nr:hypothetical protein [Abditibacteriaceae bacterium]
MLPLTLIMRLSNLLKGNSPINERADNTSPMHGATEPRPSPISPVQGASFQQPIALAMGLLLVFLCGTIHKALADVALSPLFSDNMVLQRNANVPIWGTGDVGEQVTVSIAGQQANTTADENGHWMVKLTPLPPGQTLEMTVKGKNTVTVHNIAVGELWVCSGQSNMEFTVSRGMNAQVEIAAANYPLIRMFTVKRTVAEQPRTDVSGRWDVCSPQTVGRFTAVGYFFGRDLHKALGVPIGLIHSSWGGTPAEAWTNYAVLAQDPQLKPILTRWDQLIANYPQATQQYEQKLADWKIAADRAKADGKRESRKPAAPEGPDSPHRPASLYNGMIAPLIPYGIKGVIWYQGESNAGNAKLYQKLFPTMIQNWRHNWGEGDFPFLFVQLANYMKREEQPSESNWAELREAQTMTLSQPNTAMAVTIDVGEAGDIHPKNKQEVGHRLALAALGTTYGQKVEYSGPLYDSMTVDGNKIRIRFKHTASGLGTRLVASSHPPIPLKTDGEETEFADIPRTFYELSSRFWKLGEFTNFTPFFRQSGKRTTRYEAAVALARILDDLPNIEATIIKKHQNDPVDQRAQAYKEANDFIQSLTTEFADDMQQFVGVVGADPPAPSQFIVNPYRLQGFAIAGADKKFVWADAKIDGDTVVVQSDQVPQPTTVRYAWANNPAANLYNGAGLPASPFRTDNGENTSTTRTKP